MLNTLTLRQTIDGLKKGDFTHKELYSELQEAIDKKNPELNIYLAQNEKALKQAEKARRSKLAGAPIAVKDNFCTKKMRTSASAKVLENFVPKYESTVTTKLQAAGGVIIGKTNMDAWAHGSSTETSDFGRTLNPRNHEHLPGGSSGGSAAAVAADLCSASIGSETAGSIRQPAAWCGTVGLKPTYGRVSRYGVIAMASSTDSPGPIGKTVEDCAILLSSIAGHDPYDGTSSKEPEHDYTNYLNRSISGLRIGILYSDIDEIAETNELLNKQLDILRELGAKTVKIKSMDPRLAIGVYTVVQRGEVSSNLARFDGVRMGHDRSVLGDEAKRRIMLGTYTLSKGLADQYYQTAQKVRTMFINDYKRMFATFDVLIAPTSPGYAKKIGASEGQSMFGELEDMLLEGSSITGLPGISVPYYRDPATNLFLGMNIIAPMFKEDLVIAVADAFEKNSPWNTWRNAK